MTQAERDPDLAQLIAKVTRERCFGFDTYKESCLRRRLAVRMRARRIDSYEDYAALLDRDGSEYERLLDTLTINVTKFFRNGGMWRDLGASVLPKLLDDRAAGVTCWSAGCASGEEPYTLAMLLLEQVRTSQADLAMTRIDATDLDLGSLAKAETGVYSESAFDEMPVDLRRRYFVGTGMDRVSTEVRDLVRFARHDITRDPPPASPYDLIICRNLLIYFGRATQDRLLLSFLGALRQGGYLVLGRTETILGDLRARLQLVNPRERIYRKP